MPDIVYAQVCQDLRPKYENHSLAIFPSFAHILIRFLAYSP